MAVAPYFFDVGSREVLFNEYRFLAKLVEPPEIQAAVTPTELQTAGVQIPYNLLPGYPTFAGSDDEATAQEAYLIPAHYAGHFKSFVMCPPVVQAADNWPGSRRPIRTMPGDPLMILKSYSLEALDPNKPLDPYQTDARRANGLDGSSWLQSYGHLYKAVLNYAHEPTRRRFADADKTKPETFTTIETTIGGEFINLGQQATSWTKVSLAEGGFTLINRTDPTFLTYIDSTGISDKADNQNLAFDAPLTKVIPNVEHVMTWPDVWDIPWWNIKRTLGKINNAELPWLNRAARGSVLFLGATAKKQSVLSLTGERLWTLEYRFAEKAVIAEFEDSDIGEQTAILTWNHFHRPKNGNFELLWLNKSKGNLYKEADFGLLFKRDLDTLEASLPDSYSLLRQNTERGIVPRNPQPYSFSSPEQVPGTLLP